MKLVINDNGKEKIGEKIYNNKDFNQKQHDLIIEIYKKHLSLQKNE